MTQKQCEILGFGTTHKLRARDTRNRERICVGTKTIIYISESSLISVKDLSESGEYGKNSGDKSEKSKKKADFPSISLVFSRKFLACM